MLNLTINAIGAIGAVMLVWCLIRPNLRKTPKNSQTDPILMDNYLYPFSIPLGRESRYISNRFIPSFILSSELA
jgi:hypothetical protein